MTYEEVKQRLDEWREGENVDISPEVLDRCYDAVLKQIPMKVHREGDDESDAVYCPFCGCYIGMNENVGESFIVRMWLPMHCDECGQSMIWN
jgi:hypothetical protein